VPTSGIWVFHVTVLFFHSSAFYPNNARYHKNKFQLTNIDLQTSMPAVIPQALRLNILPTQALKEPCCTQFCCSLPCAVIVPVTARSYHLMLKEQSLRSSCHPAAWYFLLEVSVLPKGTPDFQTPFHSPSFWLLWNLTKQTKPNPFHIMKLADSYGIRLSNGQVSKAYIFFSQLLCLLRLSGLSPLFPRSLLLTKPLLLLQC